MARHRSLLGLIGIEATVASNDEVYELVVTIAAGSHDVDEIAGMLRSAIKAAWERLAQAPRRSRSVGGSES